MKLHGSMMLPGLGTGCRVGFGDEIIEIVGDLSTIKFGNDGKDAITKSLMEK